jgi:hypothetical protein
MMCVSVVSAGDGFGGSCSAILIIVSCANSVTA